MNFQEATELNPEQQPATVELPVRIITPHNGLEAFTYAINSIVSDLPQSAALAWRMLVRDNKAMYRQSLLGYVWLLLPSLATVLVWVFLNKTSLVNIETGDVPYPLFVITGTVLWTAFSTSVMAMQEIIVSMPLSTRAGSKLTTSATRAERPPTPTR